MATKRFPTIMARASFIIEPSEDIQFFHRPLPAEGADLILHVEDQIAELLSGEESLDDVLYRFMETDDGVLIAVARKKTLERKPVSLEKCVYRLPSAVVLWLKARDSLKQDERAFLYHTEGDHAWLIYADRLQIYRVYRIRTGQEHDGELVMAIDKLAEKSAPRSLYCSGELSGAVRTELACRSIECMPLTPAVAQAPDRTMAEAWDFRLPSEQSGQELRVWKLRMMKSILFAGAGIALAWLLLFCGNLFSERAEERAAQRWSLLRSSLKEITYLQRETRGLIAEITLCRTLADRRTDRARVLQKIAQSRPPEVMLDRLRIGERKKRFVKGASAVVAEETVLIEGFSADPKGITAWMDALLKSGAFTSVNLLSMERKEASYRYQIECGLPVR
jgi:Tfp pilus assembly protein PilN